MKISAIHVNIATKASLRNHIVRNIQVHVNYQFQVFAQYAIKHLILILKEFENKHYAKKLFEYMPNINKCQT